MTTLDESHAEDPRRRRLLDAALGTFVRYGYRKTSMEEVARAAHVSRQGLYLHFATKEDLFRAVIRHALGTGLDAAAAALRDDGAALEDKLTGAFDAWVGRYVGMIGADVADLEEAIALLGGSVIPAYEEQLAELVAKAIRASGLPAAYKPAGLSARDLTDTLHAAARGLKHACATRAEFVARIGKAVRAVCMPLRGRA